jgi:hypothetical protein
MRITDFVLPAMFASSESQYPDNPPRLGNALRQYSRHTLLYEHKAKGPAAAQFFFVIFSQSNRESE